MFLLHPWWGSQNPEEAWPSLHPLPVLLPLSPVLAPTSLLAPPLFPPHPLSQRENKQEDKPSSGSGGSSEGCRELAFTSRLP
jgi:hypothetical protein